MPHKNLLAAKKIKPVVPGDQAKIGSVADAIIEASSEESIQGIHNLSEGGMPLSSTCHSYPCV